MSTTMPRSTPRRALLFAAADTSLPRTYCSRVLADLCRHYGHLLPSPVHFWGVSLPSGVWSLAVRTWGDRRLGSSLPPGHKIDGDGPSDSGPCRPAPDASPVDHDDDDHGENPDGVWDFRRPYGVLLIRSPGHRLLEPGLYDGRVLVAAMGGPRANVGGLERWVAAEVRRRDAAARKVVDLHGCSGVHDSPPGLRVDPATVLLPPGVRETLLREVDLFCAGRAWYADQGLPWRRGVLLYGPPGNGKTSVSRMLASRFLDRGGAAFAYSPCRRCDDDALRTAFRRAAEAAPAILALEDIDALQETAVTRSGLLALLDGSAGHNGGVFVCGTTNYPEAVDPALAGRAGRFDRAVHLPEPGDLVRRAYLERRWRGRPQEALLDAAVAATSGLSVAALNEVHHYAAMQVRDAGLPTPADLRDYIGTLRRVEASRRDPHWARGGAMGFGADRTP